MIYDVLKFTGIPTGPQAVGGSSSLPASQSDRTGVLQSSPVRLQDIPPLSVRLYRKEDGTRTVVVTDGSVVETLPRWSAGGDSIREWPVSGTRDLTYPNLYFEYAIAANETIGVVYEVDEEGYITGDPLLEVRPVADGTRSTHYEPPVGPTDGTAGDCYYVLAKLVGTAPDDYLEVYHSGSNIDYTHDLPTFKKLAASTGMELFVHYLLSTGRYEYKGFTADSPLKWNSDTNDLRLSWDDVKDLDLIVKQVELVAGTTDVTVTIPSLTVSGTAASAGAHTHTQTDHTHDLHGHHHDQYGGGQTGSGIDDTTSGAFSATQGVHESSVTTGSDGAHNHSVSGTTASASTTVTVPTYTIEESTDPADTFVIVFRSGRYHSVVATVALANAIADNGSKTVKTIYPLKQPV